MPSAQPPPRTLIVNADDFGWTDHTVEVAQRCFQAGVVSSASMMVNRPGFARAAAFARAHPQHAYGLHLCLVDEFPVSPAAAIPSLVDRTGRLHSRASFLGRAFAGSIRSADLCREIRAQVACMRAAGIAPTHFDSHGHTHKLPIVARALLRLADETGVPAVRCPQDLFYDGRGRFADRLYNRHMRKAKERREAREAVRPMSALEACIIQHESGGNPQAVSGIYMGIGQWEESRWLSDGGGRYAPTPLGASYAEQERILRGEGEAGMIDQQGRWDGCA